MVPAVQPIVIAYAKECLCDVIAEIEPLLELHYQELCSNKDRIKLNPNWKRYTELEHANAFHVFTARKDGELIAYSAFFLCPHMHYQDTIVALNDVLFLHPAHRNGMTGIRMIKFPEPIMQSLGAHKMTFGAKYSNDLKQILYRLGYVDEDAIMGKML